MDILRIYMRNRGKFFSFSIYVSAIFLIFMMLSFSCTKDPNQFPDKYINYLYFCPDGVGSCYEACKNKWDKDNSGQIEPGEEPEYDSCKSSCRTKCDTSFWLLVSDD